MSTTKFEITPKASIGQTPNPYYTLCVESFLAETRAHIQLEEHFKTCPECDRLHPEVCEKAKEIIEQQNQQTHEHDLH